MELGAVINVTGLAILAAVGVFLLVLSLDRSNPSDVQLVTERLSSYAGRAPLTVDEIELGRPILERVFGPVTVLLRRLLSLVTPASLSSDVVRRLNLAGRPFNLNGTDFQVLRVLLAVLGMIAGLGLGIAIGQLVPAAGLVLAGALIGYWAPRFWLDSLGSRRKKEIVRALPNALDLMSVSVEAGLGFEVAMRKVADRYHNALAAELDQALTETALGRPRVDALNAMAERVGVTELHNFASAVGQSQEFGTSISSILSVQADEIRRRRFIQARERAARAPLRMLAPMLTCIFPTLWVVLLGPALLLLFSTFGWGR